MGGVPLGARPDVRTVQVRIRTGAPQGPDRQVRGILIALSAMMFFCTSVVPAPMDV
jgi:hypothetical protein